MSKPGLLGLLLVALSAALVASCLGFMVGRVTAAEANRYAWLTTGPTTGVKANLALGYATLGQDVFVSVGGTAFLDIVQIGAKKDATGRHLFAAWGRGVPNGPGSLYVEKNLGPVGTGFHAYALRLSGGIWRMTVDGVVKVRISDAFRTWAIRSGRVVNETETGGYLGGSYAHPVRITAARAWLNGAWRLPHWYMGGYRMTTTRFRLGADWMTTWISR